MKINKNNYYNNTIASFEVVPNGSDEFNLVMSLEPVHENIYHPKRWWAEIWDFDDVYIFDEEEIEEERKQAEPDEDFSEVIGCVVNYNAVFEEETGDYTGTYNGYIFDTDGLDRIQYGNLPRVNSKTFFHKNAIYRFSRYWGDLGSCRWDLNIPNYEPGEQDNFILAKCKISDFNEKFNIINAALPA